MTTHKSTHTSSLPPLREGAGGGFSFSPSFGGVRGGRYTHLFFDLDNTLWDFSVNSKAALKETLEKLNLLGQLDSFDEYFIIYEQINESLWSEYRSKKVTKNNLITDRFSKSLEAFNITNQDWEEINRLYLEYMALQTRLFPGTVETLSYLKAKGYQMHIITNGFKEVQHAKLRNCNLTGFFGKIFISEEIQNTKPHRAIFEHALKSTNASKVKSIMIGDSWETDIEGALAFGMDQVMFLNEGQNKVPDSINSIKKPTNSSYFELKQNIKTWFINGIVDLTTIF